MCIPPCLWNVRTCRETEAAKGRKLSLCNGIRTKSIKTLHVSKWSDIYIQELGQGKEEKLRLGAREV